jgi:Na+/H+-dicarboxylate symporter
MVCGILCGWTFGPEAAPLGLLGKVLIDLIKALAIPLVFFAILDALATTQIPLKKAAHLLRIVATNAVLAAALGLTLSNYFHLGSTLTVPDAPAGQAELSQFVTKKFELSAALMGYLPSSVISPFAENNVIAAVLLALMIGLSIRSVREKMPNKELRVEEYLQFALRVSEQILHWLTRIVPLAVFGVVSKTVGQYGFAPFQGLLWYVLICTVGLFLHCLVVYHVWICLVAGMPLRKFWAAAYRPMIHAFGVNSSLATLPLTLKALDRLGVSKASSRLGACVGTNLNNDGILLYEAVAVLFVAQAYGIELSLYSQVAAALLCVVAAIGVAGVPEAGLISLSLVLVTVGLPIEILPLLLTVDWFVARLRSMTNVMSDLTVSIALDGKVSGPKVHTAQ